MRKLALWALLIFVFTIPMESIVEIPGFGRISKLVGIGAIAVWAVSVAASGRLRRPRPIHVAVLLFVTWNIASVLWSEDIPTSLGQSITYIQLGVLVYLLWDTVRAHDELRAVMQAYVLGACVTVVRLLADSLAGGGPYQARFTTGGFEVNSLALVLGLAIPFAWYLAVGAARRRTRILVLVDLAYIPVAVVAVLLTGSRSALLSLVPGVVYVLIWLVRFGASRRLLAVAVVGGLGVFLWSQSLVPERTLERLSTTGTAVTGGDLGGRLSTWRVAYLTFADHPIEGVGSGAFRTFGTEKAAHNVALRFLVELGVVGLTLFVSIVFLALVDARKQRRALAGLWISVLLMWGIGAAVHNFEDRKQTWLIFGMIAVGAGLPSEGARRRALTNPVDVVSAQGRP